MEVGFLQIIKQSGKTFSNFVAYKLLSYAILCRLYYSNYEIPIHSPWCWAYWRMNGGESEVGLWAGTLSAASL